MGLSHVIISLRACLAKAMHSYTAGTKSFGYVLDDLRIPIRRKYHIDEYEMAKQYLDDHLERDQVIGHSLGGAVALQLHTYCNKQGRHFHTTTCVALVFIIPVLPSPTQPTIVFLRKGVHIICLIHLRSMIRLIKIRTLLESRRGTCLN